jgi:ParB family protein of integrating conjugative element (PFGI_1 class)
MPERPPHDLAAKLLADRFHHTGPTVAAASDPIANTPMVVTLDQLRPYDLNPRVTRNPLYDELKASIQTRGLDAPPPITRRPGEAHYIICGGGNTRLQILNELWKETKDERFYRIPTLFRPWSARGEILVLTGHLVENELHGSLSFIERALGIEKARELYEQEANAPLTQTELARRLTADGYPIGQSHISRMQDAVRHLLPAIPSTLFAGLGKPQIERLIALRKSAARTWEQNSKDKVPSVEFATVFQDVLAGFDTDPATFSVQRAQDELIGHMSQLLGTEYDSLALEMVDADVRHDFLSRQPVPSPPPAAAVQSLMQPSASDSRRAAAPSPRPQSDERGSRRPPEPKTAASPGNASSKTESCGPNTTISEEDTASSPTEINTRLQGHIVSPADVTDRLLTIQRTIADATGEQIPDFERNVVQAIPVQAGGLHPISDVWYIEPGLDFPDRLRAHVAQLAREIAHEAQVADRVDVIGDGIGFACTDMLRQTASAGNPFPRAALSLLAALSQPHLALRATIEVVRLGDDLASLLTGLIPHSSKPSRIAQRLSDDSIVKLFRLIRLVRRLVDLESTAEDTEGSSSLES